MKHLDTFDGRHKVRKCDINSMSVTQTHSECDTINISAIECNGECDTINCEHLPT